MKITPYLYLIKIKVMNHLTALQELAILFAIMTALSFAFIVWLANQTPTKIQRKKREIKRIKQYHKKMWYGDESEEEVIDMLLRAQNLKD